MEVQGKSTMPSHQFNFLRRVSGLLGGGSYHSLLDGEKSTNGAGDRFHHFYNAIGCARIIFVIWNESFGMF
eukprot:scaffold5532_cov141-Skeletonema_menzelii.AAC.1